MQTTKDEREASYENSLRKTGAHGIWESDSAHRGTGSIKRYSDKRYSELAQPELSLNPKSGGGQASCAA